MDSHQHKNCMEGQYRTPCQPIDERFHQNGKTSYNRKARALSEVKIGSRVALQNHETKRWDIYGIVTDISPH